MRLLNFTQRPIELSVLETSRVLMRRPQIDDYQAWAKLRSDSANFLQPYEPTWAHDELTRSAFRARLRRHESDITSGRGLPWFLFERGNHQRLIGGLTVSNIRRGVAQCGTMGYWMGEAYAGQGMMREAVEAVCRNLFERHHLHRVEAATVVDNRRSQNLLRACGFQEEGRARAYLKINGAWKDHILFARLADDG